MAAKGKGAMKAKPTVRSEFRRNGFLYLMMVPGILFVILFSYIPMGGLVMAFQNFKLKEGFASQFNGLANFRFVLQPSIFDPMKSAILNTLLLNTLFLVGTTLVSVVLAIAFSEIGNKRYRKLTQSLSILPYFISWSVISLFLDTFINPATGVLAKSGIKFYSDPSVWRPLLVFMRIWQGAGYGAIVYLATITGIDPCIVEAADIDGATRWGKIWRITLPILRPTVVLLALFSIGRIFNGDFGMIYALVGDNSQLYSTTDVVDTYVYRMMRTMNQYGVSTAIGMLQSVCGFIFVIGANALARKLEPDSSIF